MTGNRDTLSGDRTNGERGSDGVDADGGGHSDRDADGTGAVTAGAATVGGGTGTEAVPSDLRVLSLVTDDGSPVYRKQVASLDDQGIAATTLSVPGEHEYDADADADGSRSVLDYVRFYPTVLRASFGDYDVCHANYGLTAPAALAQPALPVVVSLWGSDLMGEYGAVSAWCAEHADAVIVMSAEMADELDCECHVVPHGIDLDRFRPIDRAAARDTLGWDPDASHVLFPYPPEREVKDFPRARRIVDRVRDRVEDRVEFQVAGGVPHDRMAHLYSAADVVLLTSRREGSPNTVKEAMACDCPVVATDVGDVGERLDGVEPSAVASDDDELAAATATVLRRGERSNGRNHARDLSTRRMGERLRAVYREVLP